MTVLHLAPHPDDEAVAAGATLLALRDAGHRVVNLACGLGSDPSQHTRRRGEAEEACRRAGFALVVRDPAQPLETAIAQAAAGADLVIGPAPEEAHPAHEAVARAARAALGALAARPRVWSWGLWSDIARPTIYHGFGAERLAELQHVLAAHAGELARNDYATLVRARAEANRVLGAERVFGFGAAGRPEPYAELLRDEADPAPRLLDPRSPLGAPGP